MVDWDQMFLVVNDDTVSPCNCPKTPLPTLHNIESMILPFPPLVEYLGGGFKYFLLFTPTTWGYHPIWRKKSFNWVGSTTNEICLVSFYHDNCCRFRSFFVFPFSPFQPKGQAAPEYPIHRKFEQRYLIKNTKTVIFYNPKYQTGAYIFFLYILTYIPWPARPYQKLGFAMKHRVWHIHLWKHHVHLGNTVFWSNPPMQPILKDNLCQNQQQFDKNISTVSHQGEHWTPDIHVPPFWIWFDMLVDFYLAWNLGRVFFRKKDEKRSGLWEKPVIPVFNP